MNLGEEEAMSSEYCSSGCQSGWTTYLEQSSPSSLANEDEEDQSMVSDASSGAPQFPEEDEKHCRCLAPAAAMAKDGLRKKRVGGEQQKEHSSLLADTATSPHFSYSKTCFNNNNSSLDLTCSFSYETHLKENSTLQKQIGYFQSFAPVKPTPARPGSKRGENKL